MSRTREMRDKASVKGGEGGGGGRAAAGQLWPQAASASARCLRAAILFPAVLSRHCCHVGVGQQQLGDNYAYLIIYCGYLEFTVRALSHSHSHSYSPCLCLSHSLCLICL